MKYFTYNLKPIAPGEAIGPSIYLPPDSSTGHVLGHTPYIYYGAAEIENIDILKDFNAVEITKEEFDVAYSGSTGTYPPIT
jgi:hypothetical protein